MTVKGRNMFNCPWIKTVKSKEYVSNTEVNAKDKVYREQSADFKMTGSLNENLI